MKRTGSMAAALVLTGAFLLGIDARGNSPAELDAWMRAEIAKWAQIAREANLKPE
jgi:hypothetical protein